MKIGFIVNPIAGMGGKVGLKGTDNVLEIALKRGAKPVAPKKAIEFLKKLKERESEAEIEILTCPKTMGESEAKTASVPFTVLPMKIGAMTTAEDSKTAVKLFKAERVDLLVFVGGDGTARDVFDAINDSGAFPVLGVPSGVKMYSGIFAVNSSDAVDVVLALAEGTADIADFEIVDADEKSVRDDVLQIKIHGFLKGPFLHAHIQGSKQLSPETLDEKESQAAIARFIIEETNKDATLILGPGTTVKSIADILNVKKTILGVDIYRNGKVTLDVDENKILNSVDDWKNAWIVLSPIGRQGILLGRGNQQISPEIIRRIGKERIVIAATKTKLQNIDGNVLRVDTGDAEVDDLLKGYMKVVTDYREWRLVKIQ